MKKVSTIVVLFIFCLSIKAQPKATKKENVIYGMISGMALLMDVYLPEHPNHKGIVFICGSAFGLWNFYQSVYNQSPLKNNYSEDLYMGKYAQDLVHRGYTVFMINHRFAPRFHYPDPLEDCRRAVRFIRYHATDYQIDPQKIGAMGHSSGAYMAAMLGLVDEPYANPEHNNIDSTSSRVQAVVSIAAPFDLNSLILHAMENNNSSIYGLMAVLNYMGEMPAEKNGVFLLSGKYAEASPITQVSKGDAPMLIYYSDNDPLIPVAQELAMYDKLKETGIATEIFLDAKQDHFPRPDMEKVDQWFQKWLN